MISAMRACFSSRPRVRSFITAFSSVRRCSAIDFSELAAGPAVITGVVVVAVEDFVAVAVVGALFVAVAVEAVVAAFALFALLLYRSLISAKAL